MQLKHLKTVVNAGEAIAKITAICWSPNNLRMAAVSTNRIVYLFDENGEQKDKFPTKPGDANVDC
jgi:intraflagellar transport protein 172